MYRFTAALCALALAVIVATSSAAPAANPVTFYVAKTGSDSWSGRLASTDATRRDGPFATVQRAIDAASSELAEGAVTVSIRAGRYSLSSPITLTGANSGSKGALFTIEAFRGEDVSITGSRTVTGWQPYRGAILAADVHDLLALPRTADPHWIPMSSITQGEGDRTITQRCELFVGGKRMELARWPNASSKTPIDGWAFVAGSSSGTRTQFHYQGDAPSHWKRPELAQVHIFGDFDWHDDYRNVATVDPHKRLITLAAPAGSKIKTGRRFYVRNVFEELDAPGEWYLDEAAGKLYMIPPAKESKPSPELSLLPSVFVFKDVHDVVLRGLTIENATGDAVYSSGSSRLFIDNCHIRNAGKIGLCFVGGEDVTVQGCAVNDTGSDGILISAGDRKTLASGRYVVTNNRISRFGQLVECYTPGLALNGVGVTATHNLIEDGPHSAILITGNDHNVAYNEIRNVCLQTADCGAIYSGFDWTFRGNRIAHNRITDVPGLGFVKYDLRTQQVVYASAYGAQGVYLDDGVAGFDVTGNIISRIGNIGILLGGGRDTLIAGNIVADTRTAFASDARFTSRNPGLLRERLAAVPYASVPWKDRYPKLAAPMRLDSWPEGNEITGNIFYEPKRATAGTFPLVSVELPVDASVVDRNVYWNAGGPVALKATLMNSPQIGSATSWPEWQRAGFDKHGLVADPQFVDPLAGNFTLRTSSPARAVVATGATAEAPGLLASFPAKWRPLVAKSPREPMAYTEYRMPLVRVDAEQPANVIEVEMGELAGGATSNDDQGASKEGYVGNMQTPGASVTLRNVDGGAGDRVALRITYATPNDCSTTLVVNGKPQRLKLTGTGAWGGDGAFRDVTVDVILLAGPHNVLQFRTEAGDYAVNLDKLTLQSVGATR
ncbi:MAG TPA: right-handed parallel beta-helix repeat-containing protein [Capsulimonadaceae bacterium]|jgi:hypothetical protein